MNNQITTTNISKLLAIVCRWAARIIGTLLAILIVVIGIGEGMPNPFTQPPAVQIGFLALAMIMIGILAGWRWELAGGVILLAGWCLFVGAVINSSRGLNWFFWALAMPGFLYVISALLRRHNKRQT
jgi:hypothetical protein